MPELKTWFKDNQVIVIALIGQAIVAGIYMVNLEARVTILEVRGSPHLEQINTRLTVNEKETEANEKSIERIKDVMTKNLSVNPADLSK
jgi:hypothetical protein